MCKEAINPLQSSGLDNNTDKPVTNLKVNLLVQAAVDSGVYRQVYPCKIKWGFLVAEPHGLVTGPPVVAPLPQ